MSSLALRCRQHGMTGERIGEHRLQFRFVRLLATSSSQFAESLLLALDAPHPLDPLVGPGLCAGHGNGWPATDADGYWRGPENARVAAEDVAPVDFASE